MAVIENAATSPEALAAWRASMRGMDRAELMAQQLVQRGAEHVLAELRKVGVTQENCAAMLTSIREGLIEIHTAAIERGIDLISYSAEADRVGAPPAKPSNALTGTQRPAEWRDMSTAPKDGTLLRLLVDFEHHATEDGEGPQPTIGSNTWDNHHDFDEWQFAGWNWEQDCYTQGIGKPVGWLPMLDAAAPTVPALPGWWSAFIENICELPDRNSPEDEPEAMVATPDELENCAMRAMERLAADQPAERKDGAA